MHEGHRERLRQRYRTEGLAGFQEHEALELLLTYAIPRQNTNGIAHTLLARFGSMANVLAADIPELCGVDGIGESSAVFLRLLGELIHKEMHTPRKPVRRCLNTPHAGAYYALQIAAGAKYECLWVLSLDKNKVLRHAEHLVTGTLTEVPFYPRRVVESALQNRAHSIILLHNHPSGDPTPSSDDITITEQVKEALRGLDITLHDHLIAGHKEVYSWAKNLIIEPAEDPRGNPANVRRPAAWLYPEKKGAMAAETGSE